MRTITIRKPIWDGLKVGIAEYKLVGGEVAINIDYTDKHGELLFPDTYLLTKREAMHYPQQKVRGTTLRIIPIEELAPDGILPVEVLAPEVILPIGELAPDHILPIGELAPDFIIPIGEMAPDPIIPIGELAPDFIIPIGELAPEVVVPIETLAPDSPLDDPTLDDFEAWLEKLK